MSARGRPSRSIARAATISAWVESSPPETPITILRLPDRVQPLLEPGHLDVVGLVAVQRQPRGVVGDEREPVDLAAQPDVAGGRVELELDDAELPDALVVGAAVVVEGALAQPLLADPVEVDVGDAAPRPLGEPLGLRQQVAALVDQRLAVPRQVGGRLALPRGGVEVRRVAARARRRDQQPSVLGAGDGDRAAREVGEHGRPGQRGLRTRRDRHPHVLADLDVQRSPGTSSASKIRSGPNGTSSPAEPIQESPPVVARGEVPPLVELAVGRQVGLGRDAEHPAPVHDHRAVEHPGAVHERRPHDDDRQQVGGRCGQLLDGRLDLGQQGVLEQQVVDGVAAQGELGEDRHGHALVMAGAHLGQHRGEIGPRVGHRHRHRARGHAGEALGVRRGEVHARSLGAGSAIPRTRPARPCFHRSHALSSQAPGTRAHVHHRPPRRRRAPRGARGRRRAEPPLLMEPLPAGSPTEEAAAGGRRPPRRLLHHPPGREPRRPRLAGAGAARAGADHPGGGRSRSAPT